MEEMVEAAINAGFEHWGFSPHSPLAIESSCNMSVADVPKYFAEVDRLRKQYAGRIKLYASMEIDYLNGAHGPATGYFQELPLDYRIGSVHFVPSKHGYIDVDGRFESFKRKMSEHFDNDIRYVVDAFYNQSLAMVESGGFDIIGHFDKIGYNASLFSEGIEDEPWYEAHVSRLTDAIIASGVAVEVNTKAWQDSGRMFPLERHLKRLVEAGVTIVVNSDAHYPEKVDSGRSAGLSMVRRLEEQTIKNENYAGKSASVATSGRDLA
jgi:histidinol-phosphatase (PHP family)